MIKLENVEIKREDHLLLQNINLSINKGAKTVITGHSGSGKTSLLLAIMGCYKINVGIIKVNSLEVNSHNLDIIRKSIAYIAQEPVLGTENVHDALLLPFTFKANHSNKPELSRIHQLLERVNLKPSILKKNVISISGGEKQRIAIIRAILMKKKIFLVDEATTGLGSVSRKAVIDIFKNSEYTVLSVSHDPEWIKQQNEIYQIQDYQLVCKSVSL